MFHSLVQRLLVGGAAGSMAANDSAGAAANGHRGRESTAARRAAGKNQRRLSSGESLEKRALMAADFNNDGFDDLAIGVPGKWDGPRANAGEVVVTYGAAGAAYVSVQRLSTPVHGMVASADDFFGKSLATGDFNGDGFDDLAIGVPGDNTGVVETGAVVEM